MSVRTFEDVAQIIHPAPDSQYRLTPCDCGSTQVVYAQYIDQDGGLLWRVVCTDCGATVDERTPIRHQAQMAWNSRRKNHG